MRRLCVLCPDDVISGTVVTQEISARPSSAAAPQGTQPQRLSNAIETHLRRYFDLDVEYKRPAGLDLPPDDEPDEPLAEDTPRGDDEPGADDAGGDKRLQVVTSDEGESDPQPSQGGGTP